MAETAPLNINDLVKSITVNIAVTGCTKFRIKQAVGIFLIKSGIRIIGMGVKVEIKD